MIEIQCLGAAQTVTGSKHLIKTSQATVLLDYGMFQGRRAEAYELNSTVFIDVNKIDAVVLSHAHIDHSGLMPQLYKNGYRGSIYTTSATRDLSSPMLLDTANIMKSDKEHIEKLIKKGKDNLQIYEPLYDSDDVVGLLSLIISAPYRRKLMIAKGIDVTFLDAGHVLGSAICVFDIEDEGEKRRVVFTGDLGRTNLPILNNPEVPTGANWLITESTYGDRLHEPIEDTIEGLAKIIGEAHKLGGKILIPSFALERTQEILHALKHLFAEKRIPNIPVYVDSPLAVKLTEIFKIHPEFYDKDMLTHIQNGESPFEFDNLHYVSSVIQSKELDEKSESSIIISASGMCEGGRVLHHLTKIVENPKNTVIIVGYQAEHTLGRKLVEKQNRIRIFGVPYERKCNIEILNGFSAHADQRELLEFAVSTKNKGSLEGVILVHGERNAQEAFKEKLMDSGIKKVFIPAPRDTIKIC